MQYPLVRISLVRIFPGPKICTKRGPIVLEIKCLNSRCLFTEFASLIHFGRKEVFFAERQTLTQTETRTDGAAQIVVQKSNILSIAFSNEDLCQHQNHIPYFCLNHGDDVQFVLSIAMKITRKNGPENSNGAQMSENS